MATEAAEPLRRLHRRRARAPPPPPPEPEPPGIPEGLRVSATGLDFIEWTWTTAEGADAYDVHVSRNNDAMDFADTIAITMDPSYRLAELEPDTSATVWVRSASGTGGDRLTSEWSAHVSGMTLPPPPPPEPPDIAGDWLLEFQQDTMRSVEPSEGCFVDEWWTASRGSNVLDFGTRILRIEQEGEELTATMWVGGGDAPWPPPDLDEAQAGWRLTGTASVDGEILLDATQRWAGAETMWRDYPYAAGEFPVENFLGDKCPEYQGEMLSAEVAGVRLEMQAGDGVSGHYSSQVHWTIGEETWVDTEGPIELTVSPYE